MRAILHRLRARLADWWDIGARLSRKLGDG